MRTNEAKRKMMAGQPAYGYTLGLGSVAAAEQISRLGPDFVFIDTQHGLSLIHISEPPRPY